MIHSRHTLLGAPRKPLHVMLPCILGAILLPGCALIDGIVGEVRGDGTQDPPNMPPDMDLPADMMMADMPVDPRACLENRACPGEHETCVSAIHDGTARDLCVEMLQISSNLPYASPGTRALSALGISGQQESLHLVHFPVDSTGGFSSTQSPLDFPASVTTQDQLIPSPSDLSEIRITSLDYLPDTSKLYLGTIAQSATKTRQVAGTYTLTPTAQGSAVSLGTTYKWYAAADNKTLVDLPHDYFEVSPGSIPASRLIKDGSNSLMVTSGYFCRQDAPEECGHAALSRLLQEPMDQGGLLIERDSDDNPFQGEPNDQFRTLDVSAPSGFQVSISLNTSNPSTFYTLFYPESSTRPSRMLFNLTDSSATCPPSTKIYSNPSSTHSAYILDTDGTQIAILSLVTTNEKPSGIAFTIQRTNLISSCKNLPDYDDFRLLSASKESAFSFDENKAALGFSAALAASSTSNASDTLIIFSTENPLDFDKESVLHELQLFADAAQTQPLRILEAHRSEKLDSYIVLATSSALASEEKALHVFRVGLDGNPLPLKP